jgi:hypothetical protein
MTKKGSVRTNDKLKIGEQKMSLITKVDPEKLKNISLEEQKRLEILKKELSPKSEFVILGEDVFEIEPFGIESNLEFSKFQQEYRKIVQENPQTTFEELMKEEKDKNIVAKVLAFLNIDVDTSLVTFKQFKYLMWVIAKNYVFTEISESGYVNSMSPFFFI